MGGCAFEVFAWLTLPLRFSLLRPHLALTPSCLALHASGALRQAGGREHCHQVHD